MARAVSEGAGRIVGNELPPRPKEGGIVMMKQYENNHGFRPAALLSPAALRIELLGIVTLVLILGRSLPEFGKLLLRFSAVLFP
jgi:hypothetical protein